MFDKRIHRMKKLVYILVWMIPLWAVCGYSQMAKDLDGTASDVTTPFLTAQVVEGKLWVDVPSSLLEKPLLWTSNGNSEFYDSKHVQFRKEGERLYLEQPRVWSEMGIWLPLNGDISLERIFLGEFPIMEYDGNAYRIDMTSVVLDGSIPWQHMSSLPRLGHLSEVVGAKHKEGELIVQTKIGLSKEGISLLESVFFSFLVLPEPMEPRPYDYRMAYCIEDQDRTGDQTENKVGSIGRWRLAKKFKDREQSVPQKPITFLVSPDIPEKWRPYVKAGVLEWLPAFESAGFTNAIIVKEMDSLDAWENRSLGNSVIRWGRNQNVRGREAARGGGTVTLVIDHRSGEIIKSDILLETSLQRLQDEYFVRCAALDPRARYPFPDALTGELIQFLTAHETGHALGIKDNHFGEFQYPLERMGDAQWLKEMGHTPSVMSYARHNNMAQPKDSVPPHLLIQKVGPTDHYYIQWAYTEFPEGWGKKQKSDRLEEMIRWQDSVPWYRYNNSGHEIIGPGNTNEVVETNDPVGGAKRAMANLERAFALLPDTNQGRTDMARSKRIYAQGLELWYHTMRNVLSMVGGYEVFYKSMDQEGNMYTPVDFTRQQEAMDYFMEQAFDPPQWLTHPDLGMDIRYSSHPDLVLNYQKLLLMELMRPQRMKRLEHLETLAGFEGALDWYVGELQQRLFMELLEGTGKVPARKQAIQALYLEKWNQNFQKERFQLGVDEMFFAHSDNSLGVVMEQLLDLKRLLRKSVKRHKKLESSGHWTWCLAKLEELSGGQKM